MHLQDIISNLASFWSRHQVAFVSTWEKEMGAGTFSPLCFFPVIDNKPFRCSYVCPSRRPSDGRAGKSPNRLLRHHQFQVLINPAPDNIQQLCLESLAELGITDKEDIKFICNDWESPTLGAFGVGWEVWVNGLEVLQFTYFQKFADQELELIPVELAYGLERLALVITGGNSVFDLLWSPSVTYGSLFLSFEEQSSKFYLQFSNVNKEDFSKKEEEINFLLERQLVFPAYEAFLDLNVILNKLDARKFVSYMEKKELIERTRKITEKCARCYKDQK